jgi:hypothetical protein
MAYDERLARRIRDLIGLPCPGGWLPSPGEEALSSLERKKP